MADDTSTVPLADPGGNVRDIPTDQAQDLLDNGYSQPTAQQTQAASDAAKNSTLNENLQGAFEGAANTATLGAFTKFAVDHGVDPNDIKRRSDTIGHAIGMGIPLVAAQAIPGVGEALAADTLAGGAAVSGAETALMQAGDEHSKMILDPNYSVGNALHNVGMAAVFGGALGAGGKLIGRGINAAAGSEYAQIANDFKARAQELIANPDPASSITTELQGADDFINKAAVYGEGGLKDQIIQKLAPEVDTSKAFEQAQDVAQQVRDGIAKAQAEPGIYQGARINALSDYANRLDSALQTAQDPAAIFKSLNEFKQGIGELGNWSPLEGAAQKPGAGLIKDIYGTVKAGLEDSDTWGKLGKFQAATNEATSELINAEKQLNKFKSIGADGQRVLDPNKIATYVNQAGKGNAEIKQGMVQSYLDAIDKYGKNVSNLHTELGIEAPTPPPSMQAIKATLGKPTLGGKMADFVIKKGLSQVAGDSLGGAAGAGLGSLVGSPAIGALLGQRAIGPFLNKVLPAIAQPIIKAAVSGPGLGDTAAFGLSALKGQTLLKGAADAVIKGGKMAVLKQMLPSKEDTQKLQSQVSLNQKNPQAMIASASRIGDYLPAHSAAIAAKMTAVQQYLTAAEPKPVQPAPFDRPIAPTKQQQMAYERTLQIAEQPLSLAHHIAQGSLLPSDVKDLNAMHPDVHQAMTQELLRAAVEHTAEGKAIPYKTQQSISLFAGQPLNSTMTPQSIQAVQAVYSQQQQAQSGPAASGKAKGSTKSLNKIGDEYKTPGQARQADKQSND